jgi:hypothetical protein
MMNELKKIDEKLEKINDRLGSVDVTLVRQEVNLQEHMRRTELNEIAVEKISQSIIPIYKHINMLEGVLKFFGLLAVLGSIVTAIFKIASFL